MMGLIFDIQRFSTQDGPGIRTTVFLQGCTLHCQWCHNPEGIPARPVLRWFQSRCILCGACERVCPNGVHRIEGGRHLIDRSRCRQCGACVKACPTGALRLSSREMSGEDVMRTVLEDRPFYRQSGGGLTISGGEPLFQAAFCLDLLRLAKAEGLHTALETAGHVPAASLLQALPVTDLFLYDYKTSSDSRSYIGADSQLILSNLKMLHDRGAAIILRCPIIPGVNDSRAHLEAIAGLLEACGNIQGVELMAYHRLGFGKYKETGEISGTADAEPMGEDMKEAFLGEAQRIFNHPVKWG
ncbi:MAG: glycyl-radical enzyme activating protein [Christensenellales bacterium]